MDDGFDFPPTAHPGRELFTAILFVLLVLALLIWGGWKLISLTSAARRPPPHHATVMMDENHYFFGSFSPVYVPPRLLRFRSGSPDWLAGDAQSAVDGPGSLWLRLSRKQRRKSGSLHAGRNSSSQTFFAMPAVPSCYSWSILGAQAFAKFANAVL